MSDVRSGRSAIGAFAVVTSLFLAWGFITSMIDPLIVAVKGIYSLGDREALLTQFAFFISYGVISLPAAALLTRAGHVRTILIALAAMLAACLIILLATFAETYALVLFGLFVLGSGITALQVAANPLSAALGDPSRSHFRLVFSQAFNSLGTVIGPYLGARIMLQGTAHEGGPVDAAARTAALGHIHTAFLVVAVLMALLIAFIWASRQRIGAAAPAPVAASPLGALGSGWALFGALAIFLYVGAEVSIGSLLGRPGRSRSPANRSTARRADRSRRHAPCDQHGSRHLPRFGWIRSSYGVDQPGACSNVPQGCVVDPNAVQPT